jgi:triosephosphate isomerase
LTQSRPLIAGNWKMHGLEASLDQARAVAAAVDAQPPAARIALCPPATLIARMSDLLAGSTVLVGGQDCAADSDGPFTGDISGEMLADAGASLVILGHSERRIGHGESDQIVAAKVIGALRAGLEPIVCVGESGDERRAGGALGVVVGQVRACLPQSLSGRAFAVAYEPIWAIGTGVTPSLGEIEEVHDAVREALVEMFGEEGEGVPILYGGSVKAANAAQVLGANNVCGALVGGASLQASQFISILNAV